MTEIVPLVVHLGQKYSKTADKDACFNKERERQRQRGGGERERERDRETVWFKIWGAQRSTILISDSDADGPRTTFYETLIKFTVVTDKAGITESQLPGIF